MRHWPSVFAVLVVGFALLVIILPRVDRGAHRQIVDGQNEAVSDMRPSLQGRPLPPKDDSGEVPAFENESGDEEQNLPLANITGVVLAADSGSPLPGAVVVFDPENGATLSASGAVRTDESGKFLLEVPQPGSGMLHVLASGYIPSMQPAAPQSDEARIYLQRGRTVSGRVIDDRGDPIPDAEVFAYSLDSSFWPLGTLLARGRAQTGNRTLSGPDGAFLLSGLAEGQVSVGARKRGYLTIGDRQEVSPGASGIDVVLRPLLRARLLIVDASTGEKVLGARVLCFPATPGVAVQPGRAEDLFGDLEDRDGLIALVRDERGLEQIPEFQRARVRVQHPRYQPGEFLVDLSGEEMSEVRIELVPLPEGPTRDVLLRALLMSNMPFTGGLEVRTEAGQHLLFYGAGKPTRTIELPVGRQRVGIRGARPTGWWYPAESKAQEIVVEDTADKPQVHTLVLAAGAVELDVVDSKGRPVAEYDLDVALVGTMGGGWYPHWRGEFSRFLRAMDAQGLGTELSTRRPHLLLSPGRYTVRARDANRLIGSVEVHLLAEGETERAHIVLQQE